MNAAAAATPPARCDPPSISAVVPAYNEAQNLPELLPLLARTLGGLTPRWEIVVVDDGSTDDTPRIMAGWTATPGVRYLRLSRNFGKEAALTARGETVVLLDADLQHPPAMIATML